MDPKGFAVFESLLPPYVTYMERIDSNFKGTLHLNYEESLPYTHKTQYLKNVQLTGELSSGGVIGNSLDNILIGNSGNNTIDGRAGSDVVQYALNSNEVVISHDGEVVIVSGSTIGEDRLTNIETLRFLDVDLATLDL